MISRYLFNKKKLLSSVSALSVIGAAVLLPTQSEAACVTTGLTTSCDTATPNPWTQTVGNGGAAEDNRIVIVESGAQINVSEDNAISLGDNVSITIKSGATVSNNVSGGSGHNGIGANTIDFLSNGTLTIEEGAVVEALGTSGSAETINVKTGGNTVINSGRIHATYTHAIWFENETGDQRNVIINNETGVISTGVADGNVIGSGGNSATDFTNKGRIEGNLLFAGGDDILHLFAGSVITGSMNGGAGTDQIFLEGDGDDTMAGNLDGFEEFIKQGTGTWTLSGTIAGLTKVDIREGTLVLTGNNSSAAGIITVDPGAYLAARAQSLPSQVHNDNGTVRFLQTDNGAYGGIISGSGQIIKEDAGTLTLTGTNTYTGGTLVKEGLVNVSSDANLGDLSGDVTLDGGGLQFGAAFAMKHNIMLAAGNGTIDTMANDSGIDGILSGAGGLTKTGSGALTLTGKNSYKGDTKVSAGSLIIDGNQLAATGRVSVDSGATLSGKGAVGGDVAIGSGGILQVSSDSGGPRVLTIGGDLSLQQTSIINYNYGQAAGGAPANVLAVNVGGDLTLDGTININNSSGANFPVPGIYRLINYAGTLTDNGVTLGTHPTGDYFVQTSVDHQVNLVSYVGVDANFWDGAGGARNNGRIEGGDGVWQANGSNDNWTDAHGTVNVPYTDNNFAIFTGKAGTVTVDNSKGNVRVEGMQFAVDGYVVKGGDIALGSDPATIRVGDGTKAGASYDATIASRLTGTAKLVKADLGTLVLTGENSYSGGTSVEGGVLQLGDGGTSGSITGPVALAGGTSLIANRSNGLTLGGPISGDGKVVQAGTGTTMLRGANSYKGGTEIDAGILNVAAAANLGDAASHVTIDGGTLQAGGSFEAAHAMTLAAADNIIDTQAFNTTLTGVIDGPGALHKTGTGRLSLAAVESYAGRSIISQGGLALTGAGDISASSGVTAEDTFDITGIDAAGTSIKALSGGTDGRVHLGGKQLTITAAQDDEFQGVIDGAGGLAVTGGREVLSGDNEYTGGTRIAKGGALQLGSGGNSGSVKGSIAVEGLLAFNRSDIFTADNVLTGSGTLEQIGRGTTILTADNAGFTGVTNIRSGTLQVDHTLGGAMNVLAGAYLQGEGIVGPTVNAGTIAPGNGGKDLGTLTINGDYAGNGGLIRLNTVLGDDNSATDMLVVTGNTSGTTNVRVLNRNGLGAQTDKGIKIIDVGGQSDGAFTLIGDYTTKDGKSAVVGGAYAYTLNKDGSSAPASKGDWYLRSEYIYQPGAPLYEVYGQVLNHLNTLPTLRERAGNRYWAGAGYVPIPQGDGPGTPDPIPAPPKPDMRADVYVDNGVMIWNRVEAAHAHHQPDTSTTGAEYDIDLWKMQLGIDGQFYEDETGRLIGSVWLHSASASADISAFYGDGRMEANGYGVGGALTWYDDGGYYLDGQAQVTWFDSDLTSSTLNRMLLDGDKSWGYALSSETGIRYSIDDAWTLTPQAQITYAQILLDDFTDPYGARVTFDRNAKLTARIGVAASYQAAWQDDEGYGQRADIYGIANLHQEFLDEVKMKISGHPLENSEEKTWAEIGAGGTYNWNDDRYVLFGTLTAGTGLTHPGDSYKFAGNAGFKVKW